MRHLLSFALFIMLLPLYGCGTTTDTPATPPPNPLYVRIGGQDTNTGASPAAALQTISKALQLALNGYTIIVGGGTYLEGVTTARTGGSAQGLRLLADPTGAQTGDAGPVVINAQGTSAATALTVAQSDNTVIDGFIIINSADAGIAVKSGSDGLTIQNCIVFNNAGDGIRVQDSAGVTIFNNLVYGNAGTGVNVTGTISGSPNARVLNNTIALNQIRGITIGNSSAPSKQALLRNNIIDGNTGDSSIKVFAPPPSSVPRSDIGYSEDFDLVQPFSFIPSALPVGTHDLSSDPLFASPSTGDFHLSLASPALGAGSPSSLSDAELAIVRARTTTGQQLDTTASDLGFHYLP